MTIDKDDYMLTTKATEEMNKDLINSVIIDIIRDKAVDGTRAGLSVGSVVSNILPDARRLEESETSVDLFYNTLNKIYDIARLKIDFLDKQELLTTHKELYDLLGLLANTRYERLISYTAEGLTIGVEARLDNINKLVYLLSPKK